MPTCDVPCCAGRELPSALQSRRRCTPRFPAHPTFAPLSARCTWRLLACCCSLATARPRPMDRGAHSRGGDEVRTGRRGRHARMVRKPQRVDYALPALVELQPAARVHRAPRFSPRRPAPAALVSRASMLRSAVSCVAQSPALLRPCLPASPLSLPAPLPSRPRGCCSALLARGDRLGAEAYNRPSNPRLTPAPCLALQGQAATAPTTASTSRH